MHLRWLLFAALLPAFSGFSQSRILHVCPNGNDVTLQLEWNAPDTCQQVLFGLVYGSSDGAGFSFLDTVHISDLSYVHVNAIPQSNTWFYYLRYLVKCGTQTYWFTSDTVALDNVAPDSVNIQRITVINDSVYVFWSDNDTTVASYIIYQAGSASSPSVPIDTVWGQKWWGTVFADSMAEQVYRVAAVDSCGNISLLSTALSPVNLTYHPDSCLPIVSFQWTHQASPVFMPVEAYLLIVVDTGIYDRIPLDSLGQRSLTYDLQGFPHDSFSAVLQYIGGGNDTAYSVAQVIPATNLYFPPQMQIENITVEQDTLWILTHSDFPMNIASATLQRRTPSGTYQDILSLSGPLTTWTLLYDSSANVQLQSYIYRWQWEGKCNDKGSTIGRDNSLHLHATMGEEGYAFLWNFYTTWAAFDSFHLQRRIVGKQEDPIIVAAYDYTTTRAYLPKFDDVDSLFDTVCFRLEVARPSGGPAMQWRDTAHSNWQCFLPQPIFYAPNAFRPYFGINRIFRPSIINADTGHFMMVIFNRWGKEIYRTDRLSEGWNGIQPNGSPYPEGMYLYYIAYYSTHGRKYEAFGEVHLLW